MAHILIVDDQTLVAETLSAILKHAGYLCTVANSGHTALQLFEQQRPDLVITDLTMPEMNGLEFAAHVRQRCATCPILLVTGDPTHDRGALPFMLKPVMPKELIRTIEGLLDGGVQAQISTAK